MPSPLVVTSGAADGGIQVVGGSPWSAVRGATEGSVTNSATARVAANGNTGYYELYRGFLPFDTSTIGVGSTVASGVLRLTVNQIEAGTPPDLFAVASTQASPTALAAGDFDQVGSTAFTGAITVASTNTPTDFALNADGLAAISKVGYTTLALLHKKDVENTAPNSWSNNPGQYVYLSSFETVAYRPKLTVTYTEGGTAVPVWLLRHRSNLDLGGFYG